LLLLDTHVLLWALADEELSSDARRTLADPATRVVVSAASVWEISIKRALGRLTAPHDLVGAVAATRFELLAISPAHAEAAGGLPPHHRDPFDRMLVAQARDAGLAVATRDPRFELYDVETWFV